MATHDLTKRFQNIRRQLKPIGINVRLEGSGSRESKVNETIKSICFMLNFANQTNFANLKIKTKKNQKQQGLLDAEQESLTIPAHKDLPPVWVDLLDSIDNQTVQIETKSIHTIYLLFSFCVCVVFK